MRPKVLFPISSLLAIAILALSYNDDPPTGRTGAPFDGHCNNCHSGTNSNGYNGVVEVLGLPDTVQPMTEYTLRLKVTPTAGNPFKAGFQLVIVDQNHQNAGHFTLVNTETGLDLFNTRQYIEHRSGKSFNSGPVEWEFHWTSPGAAACNAIKLYYVVNFCNGTGSDFGDFPIAYSASRYFAGAPPLVAMIARLENNICPADSMGSLEVQASGGTPPYQYTWSNGQQEATASELANGLYAVTVQDASFCNTSLLDSIYHLDTVPPQITCPASFFVTAPDSAVHFDWPFTTDNCDPTGVSIQQTDGLPNHTVFPPGETLQVFQASDGDGNTASCSFTIVVNTVAAKEPGLDSCSWIVIPQPASNHFRIVNAHKEPCVIELYHAQGQKMRNFSETDWPGPYFIGDLPAGWYWLKTKNKQGQIHRLTLIKVDD